MTAGVTADTRLGGTGMRQPQRVESANVNTRNHATKRSPSTALFSRDRSGPILQTGPEGNRRE